MDKFIGKRLDARYVIQEIIGVGGMAVVYKAYDCIDDKIVAIKILKEEFVRNSEFLNRFKNESKAIAVLSHPNIVKVLDVSFGDNFQYIVMEYIDGITLKEYMDRTGALPWKNAVYFTMQTLQALQHAHDKGIVHRDVKPQNIMLLRDGTIKVTDFGIARFARSEQKTITDKAIGSVHYISPEQARGDVIDEKADLYSVGVMLYEMLTGRLPFDGESAVSVALMHMQNDATPPREINPSIPVGLEQIVMHAMMKNPNRRYHSDAEMLRDLEEIKRDPAATFTYDEGYSVDNSPTKYIGAVGSENHAADKSVAEKIDGLYGKEKDKEEPEYEIINDDGDDDEDEFGDKKSSLLPTLAAIAAVLVVALVVFGAWFLIKYFDTGSSGQVKCPDLIGKNYEDAKKTNASIVINVKEWKYSEDYAYGQIIEQDPKEGKYLKTGATVTVTVSKGKEAVLMPNLQGYTLEDAQTELKQYNLKNEPKVEKQYHNSVASGEVIKTDPTGNAEITEDTQVTIYVSMGPEPNMVSMPGVVGISQSAATKKIEAVGLRVKIVEADSTLAKGIVLSAKIGGNSVKENDKVVYGSTVELTVSTGNPPAKAESYTVSITVPRPKSYYTDTYTVKAVLGSQEKSQSKMSDNYKFSFETTETSGTIKVYVDSNLYQTWSFKVDSDGKVTTSMDNEVNLSSVSG